MKVPTFAHAKRKKEPSKMIQKRLNPAPKKILKINAKRFA